MLKWMVLFGLTVSLVALCLAGIAGYAISFKYACLAVLIAFLSWCSLYCAVTDDMSQLGVFALLMCIASVLLLGMWIGLTVFVLSALGGFALGACLDVVERP